MRKRTALATAVVSLALVASASAATANEHASCSGWVYSTLTGQPGARADINFFGTFPDAAAYGLPPGALQSESSQYKPPAC
ncbi:MAG: hypothetical protein ABW142_05490 [Thermoleophilaceae bacterium]